MCARVAGQGEVQASIWTPPHSRPPRRAGQGARFAQQLKWGGENAGREGGVVSGGISLEAPYSYSSPPRVYYPSPSLKVPRILKQTNNSKPVPFSLLYK